LAWRGNGPAAGADMSGRGSESLVILREVAGSTHAKAAPRLASTRRLRSTPRRMTAPAFLPCPARIPRAMLA